MTTPKDDFDKHSRPLPVPDNKVLHPLFGTYTRTETFNTKNMAQGVTQHTHFEAHMDDPVKKTWTVSKVVTDKLGGFNPLKNKTVTNVHLVKAKLNFKETVELLGSLEKGLQDKPKQYEAMFPEAPMMGFAHFRAFAEREGYIFDINGKPHARPHARALPVGFTYTQADVDSANDNVQRPEDEFDNNGPLSRRPNVHFLLENFQRAAEKPDDYQTNLNGLRAMNILDRFADQIEIANEKLQEYSRNYRQMGQGGLIDDAESALRLADSFLRQLRAYGVDTTEYDGFLAQCNVATYVLHAEGLYDLMNKGSGDFNANEALFQSRVRQALDIFQQIDKTPDAKRTLENMIVQASRPQVPDAIGDYVKHYRATRATFPDAGGAKPAPAAPKP